MKGTTYKLILSFRKQREAARQLGILESWRTSLLDPVMRPIYLQLLLDS